MVIISDIRDMNIYSNKYTLLSFNYRQATSYNQKREFQNIILTILNIWIL